MNEKQSWDYQETEELSPLSSKKRNALVRYMAILFGVAFLLVLLSFLIQMRDSRETISDLSQANSSALQNAGKLQEDNQRLTQENETLREQVRTLEGQLQTAEEDARQSEKARRDTLNEMAAEQKTLASQTLANGQLFEAALNWLKGEREECGAILSRLDQEELSEDGQALCEQLETLLTSETAENADRSIEASGAAEDGEPEGENND